MVICPSGVIYFVSFGLRPSFGCHLLRVIRWSLVDLQLNVEMSCGLAVVRSCGLFVPRFPCALSSEPCAFKPQSDIELTRSFHGVSPHTSLPVIRSFSEGWPLSSLLLRWFKSNSFPLFKISFFLFRLFELFQVLENQIYFII
jgi:hypothetical protein